MAFRYIGKGVTNSDGVAHLTEDAEGETVTGYVGEGKGLTQIVASTDKPSDISDSSLQSKTYEVWDTIFAIDGTSDTGNWSVDTARTSISYSSEGTNFVSLGSGTSNVTLLVNNNSHYFDGSSDKVFEFDYKMTNLQAVYLVSHTGSQKLLAELTQYNEWHTYKLYYSANQQTVTVYVDNVEIRTTDVSTENLTTIGLKFIDWQGDMDSWIKNLKVYNS